MAGPPRLKRRPPRLTWWTWKLIISWNTLTSRGKEALRHPANAIPLMSVADRIGASGCGRKKYTKIYIKFNIYCNAACCWIYVAVLWLTVLKTDAVVMVKWFRDMFAVFLVLFVPWNEQMYWAACWFRETVWRVLENCCFYWTVLATTIYFWETRHGVKQEVCVFVCSHRCGCTFERP